MRARCPGWRPIATAGAVISFLAGVVACGNGDDNTSPGPTLDSGLQTGTLGDGNIGPLCNDGDVQRGDATLTLSTACSPYSTGCIPFDPARVPRHPTL